jgi:hypothetical protein
MSAETEPNLPEPTALAFAALSGGQVQFYAATAGREAVELVALSLGIQAEANAPLAAPPAVETVVQLVPLREESLPLVATVLTLTISVANEEPARGPAGAEVASVAAVLPGGGIALGQGLAGPGRGGGGSGADEPAQADEAGTDAATTVPAAISVWERIVLGLDEALERFRRENPGGLSGAGAGSARPAGDRPESPATPGAPAQGVPSSLRSAPELLPNEGAGDGRVEPSPTARVAVIDAAIGSLWGEGARPDRPVGAPAAAIERVPLGSAGAAPSRGSVGAAPLLIIPEPGKDEPGLGSAPILVALLAAEWGSRRRARSSRRELNQSVSLDPSQEPDPASLPRRE